MHWAAIALGMWAASGAAAGFMDAVYESAPGRPGLAVALVFMALGVLAGSAYWIMTAETVHRRARR